MARRRDCLSALSPVLRRISHHRTRDADHSASAALLTEPQSADPQ